MEIKKNINGGAVDIALKGRLDTSTAPKLEEALGALEGVEALKFDFSDLEYLSSAGLRALLAAQKTMNKQGNMVLCNVNEDVMEVFEITGFADFLTFVE